MPMLIAILFVTNRLTRTNSIEIPIISRGPALAALATEAYH